MLRAINEMEFLLLAANKCGSEEIEGFVEIKFNASEKFVLSATDNGIDLAIDLTPFLDSGNAQIMNKYKIHLVGLKKQLDSNLNETPLAQINASLRGVFCLWDNGSIWDWRLLLRNLYYQSLLIAFWGLK